MSEEKSKAAARKQCVEARAAVEDWLDELLDDEARTRVAAHLGKCRECSDYFSRRRALAGDLLTLGRAADALAAGNMSKTSPRLVRWRSWSVAAATVLFFLTAGLYLSEFRRAEEPASSVGTREPVLPGAANESRQAPRVSGRDFGMTCPEGRMLVPMASSNPRIHIVWLYDQTKEPATPVDGETVQEPASSG